MSKKQFIDLAYTKFGINANGSITFEQAFEIIDEMNCLPHGDAPKVRKHEQDGNLCPECNGEGGFQFSQDPDDCELCSQCNGSGLK